MAELSGRQHESMEQELDRIVDSIGGEHGQKPVQSELLEIILAIASVEKSQKASTEALTSYGQAIQALIVQVQVLGATLEQIVTKIDSQQAELDEILKAVQSAPQVVMKIGIHFGSQEAGANNMALSLPVGQTDTYFIFAEDADGDPGATLQTGQVIAVASASPTVVLTPDAAPGIDPKTKVQSVASGTVSIGPSPVIGIAVTITATLTAADGTTVIDTETDTVTPLVGTATKIGILLEDASVNPSPAG